MKSEQKLNSHKLKCFFFSFTFGYPANLFQCTVFNTIQIKAPELFTHKLFDKMTKSFFYSSLFCLSFLFLACNTQPTDKQETQARTAVPSVSELINSDYTTNVIEADLPSPRKEMQGHINDIKLKINYGSPSVKGREIWGALVPYDQVWRMGANEATRFTVNQAIFVNGKELAPGTYGLFCMPSKDKWQIIFNKTADQWGAYEYDETQDALRVETSIDTSETAVETMDFLIEKNKVVLVWETVQIPFVISKA